MTIHHQGDLLLSLHPLHAHHHLPIRAHLPLRVLPPRHLIVHQVTVGFHPAHQQVAEVLKRLIVSNQDKNNRVYKILITAFNSKNFKFQQ